MRAFVGLAAVAIVAVTAAAQDDPPTRAGRLAYMTGNVSVRPASDTVWGAAQPNRPLTTGDRVWTDSNSRAEVQIGQTRLRISSSTEMDIVNLDDNTIQVSVPQGTVTASVRSIDNGEADEIDTPNAAIGLSGAGVYRVDVSPDGSQSKLDVWSGAAKVTAAGSSFDVNARQTATVNGTDSPTYDIADVGPEDSWDQWSDDRDHREQASESARYVSADVAGYDDLDGNGDWRDDPTYGPVWTPTTVAVGWSPYHYGHWVWSGPWGWSWVDDAPWGWAPFHYGRWVYAENHWGWCPGRVYEHPVYAPALVAFVGGRGWSAGVSFGAGAVGIGWFPLAPEEPWYPPYHVSNTYVRNVNITNVTNVNVINVTNVNVTNINYRNREVAGAVTVVPDNAFRNGESVSRYAVRVPAANIVRAPVVGSAAPVVPTARSLAPVAALRRPPAAINNRAVVAVHQPPAARPSFSEQAKLLAAHPGQPVAASQLATLKRPAQTDIPVRSATVAARPGATLKPARANVPAPKPPTQQPGRTGYVAPTPSRPTPSQPRTVTPTPVRTPASASRVPQPPSSRPTISTAKPASPSLSQSYAQQRNQMEARHTQEAASPPAGVSQQQLATQQAQEHRQLDNNYVQARESGAKTMPPAPAPHTASAPAPRPSAPSRPASPPARKH